MASETRSSRSAPITGHPSYILFLIFDTNTDYYPKTSISGQDGS